MLAKLKQVEEALTQAQQEESQLPDALKTLQQERCPSPQSIAHEEAEADGRFRG